MIATRAQALAGRLGRLGLAEDARVAGLVAARAMIAVGRPGLAARAADRAGRPGRIDRLDTRLLWRLTRAELATATGQPAAAARELTAGLTALHRHRAQFGCLDLQTGAAVHGQDLARAGLAAAAASGSPAAVYRWAERARAQALLLPPVRPPDHPAAAAALEELRQARHSLRARGAGRAARPWPARPDRGPPAHGSASSPGPPPGGAPSRPRRPPRWPRSGPPSAARRWSSTCGRARTLARWWSPVVSARLRPLGGYAAAAEAVLRLRADLDAQAGRVLPDRLAAAVRHRHRTGRRRGGRRRAHAAAGRRRRPRPGRGPDRPPDHGAVGGAARLRGPAGHGRAVGHRLAGRPPAARGHPRAGPARGRARQRPRERGDHARSPPGTRKPSCSPAKRRTPAATLAGLEQAGIAHLAAHGQHQAENALFSTLELAGGPLLGYDLQRLARVPRMVVLSCCDLGLTDVRPGDETFGIVTALLTAGAATVVASVARVGDGTAMAAMTGFHRAVAGGAAPAAALATALPSAGQAGFVCFGAG